MRYAIALMMMCSLAIGQEPVFRPTGRYAVEVRLQPEELEGDYIVMFTRHSCSPCKRWLATERMRLEEQQVQVTVIDLDKDENVQWTEKVSATPAFWICKRKTQRVYNDHKFVGFTDADTLLKKIHVREKQKTTTTVVGNTIRSQEITNTVWGQQPERQKTVNWNGVQYSSPVCNNPNCRMCNSIRAGLGLYSVPAEDLSPDQQPTDCEVIDETLSQMDLDEFSVLLDDGCGDGRVLIEAVKRFGCTCIGIEIDPERAEVARRRVKDAGLSDRIQINPNGVCDVLEFDSAGASVTHAYVYLFPELLEKLATKLSSVRVVASPFHEVPGLGQKQVGQVWVRDTRSGI